MSVPQQLTAATAEWLCGDAGLMAVARATADLDRGDESLAVGTRLRREGLTPEQATAVLGAATARRRARERWPDADRLLFTPVGLEQASDPEVAAWRAERLAGELVWDLGAGLGADALAIAATGAKVTAVDLDAARLRLLRHNAEVRGLEIATRVGDALEVELPPGALLHADPARRRDGRRVRRLADHVPPVGPLLDGHRGVAGVALVLSPAVDLDDPDLPEEAELEFIADAEGLRETVVWGGRLRTPGVQATATLLPDGLQRHRRAHLEACPVGEVGHHLVEVVPAAVRARLHDQIGRELGARRLATRRALLTTDQAPAPSPWYRSRPVLAVLPPRARAVRHWLQDVDPLPLEIAVHGLDADPQRWWRDLGRPPRGPQGRRLELIRTDSGARAVITDARPCPAAR
jgi:SAM-dependent methyltransferase